MVMGKAILRVSTEMLFLSSVLLVVKEEMSYWGIVLWNFLLVATVYKSCKEGLL